MSLSKHVLKILINKIRNEVIDSHISKIVLLTSSEILFSLSKNKKQKLVISLNNAFPFITTCLANETITSLSLPLLFSLRNELSDAKIENIELANDDRIVKITLKRIDEAYHTLHRYIFLELFVNHTNMIVTDHKNMIIFCYKYSDALSDRPLLKGGLYTFPSKKQNNNFMSSLNKYELAEVAHLQALYKYSLSTIESKFYKSEKLYLNGDKIFSSMPLTHLLVKIVEIEPSDIFSNLQGSFYIARKNQQFHHIKVIITNMLESLNRRLNNYQMDAEKAKLSLDDKIKGDLLLTYFDSIELSNNNYVVLDNITIALDPIVSLADNANKYYKSYKKAKTALAKINELVISTNDELNYFLLLNDQFKLANYDDILDIEKELKIRGYLKTQVIKTQKSIKPSRTTPYFLIYENVRIGFGKNNLQNDELTFKYAHANHLFLHVKNYPGSHVIVFNDNPRHEIIHLAAEIALINNKLSSGEVISTLRKNVTKSQKIGLVSISSYKSIIIKNVTQNAHEIILTATKK